ncbi:MAG: hypothetical protein LC749_12180 [Actinobacteria bacterium]|nr:hypothetical protein [Actinomycetota bacterium]
MLLQRRLAAEVVIAGMAAALAIGSVDLEVVAIEARRVGDGRAPAPVSPGLEALQRRRCAARSASVQALVAFRCDGATRSSRRRRLRTRSRCAGSGHGRGS